MESFNWKEPIARGMSVESRKKSRTRYEWIRTATSEMILVIQQVLASYWKPTEIRLQLRSLVNTENFWNNIIWRSRKAWLSLGCGWPILLQSPAELAIVVDDERGLQRLTIDYPMHLPALQPTVIMSVSTVSQLKQDQSVNSLISMVVNSGVHGS